MQRLQRLASIEANPKRAPRAYSRPRGRVARVLEPKLPTGRVVERTTNIIEMQLCELAVLDGLPLRPLDLCRLGSTCSTLRDLLSHGGSCALWRQAALRTWGEAGAQCSSWSNARAHTSSRLDFDSVTAFGSRVGPTDEHASLELGSVLPYRVAAAVASLPISSAIRRVVEWTVRIDALPKLEGVVLWMCAATPQSASEPGTAR